MEKFKAVVMAMLFGLALASAPVLAESSPVNINTATVEELVEIKGIGPSKAQAIVEHRDENGKFASVEDLTAVDGIGGKLLERLRPQVTVNSKANGKGK